MRLWRTRTWKLKVGSGDFDCPACGSWQGYRLVRAQRWVQAWSLRLLAAGEPAEYVECARCRGTFERGAAHPSRAGREAIVATYQQGMLHVMAATAAAERQALDAELITKVFEALTGRMPSDRELEAALDWARAGGEDLRRYLQELEPRLNDDGKERVVHAALFVAATDGRLERRAARRVRNVARALGMSRGHLKGIVARLAA